MAVPHDTQHSDANDAIEAIEAKLGISASTPVTSSFLVGTSAGVSSWSTTPTLGATSWTNLNHAHAAANSGGQINAGNLSGATLAAGVTASSLTSVGTLTSLTMGGAIDCANNVISNIGAAGTDFSATGGLTLAAALTVTASGATITAGNLAVNGAILANISSYITGAQTIGTSSSLYGLACDTSLRKTGGTASGEFAVGFFQGGITVDTSTTVTRVAQVWGGGVTASVSGTLTNHNAAYFGTPGNGSTVNVIDTASGATLPTSGTWTNAPSWAAYKDLKGYVPSDEMERLADWFADGWRPQRYRHSGKYLGVCTCRQTPCICRPAPAHQEYEYDAFFPVLDDMPGWVREIICAGPSGHISTKDMDGALGAVLAVALRRIRVLEARLN